MTWPGAPSAPHAAPRPRPPGRPRPRPGRAVPGRARLRRGRHHCRRTTGAPRADRRRRRAADVASGAARSPSAWRADRSQPGPARPVRGPGEALARPGASHSASPSGARVRAGGRARRFVGPEPGGPADQPCQPGRPPAAGAVPGLSAPGPPASKAKAETHARPAPTGRPVEQPVRPGPRPPAGRTRGRSAPRASPGRGQAPAVDVTPARSRTASAPVELAPRGTPGPAGACHWAKERSSDRRGPRRRVNRRTRLTARL